jgi:Golgi apparatus protein 1
MTNVPATAIASAAFLTAIWAPSSGFAQANLRDRVAAAIETIERSCGEDINAFCGKVTRGEGRLLLCMQAHEDQVSRRCQFALYRVSRRLENALHRVERTADACWSDIEAQCGDADRIGQCVVQKRASFSNACQSTVEAIQQAVQGLVGLRGMAVYSSDDKSLGNIVDIKRGADGKLQSIEVEVGRFLGLGSKVVDISADKLEEFAERIKLRIGGDQVRSLPEAQKQ